MNVKASIAALMVLAAAGMASADVVTVNLIEGTTASATANWSKGYYAQFVTVQANHTLIGVEWTQLYAGANVGQYFNLEFFAVVDGGGLTYLASATKQVIPGAVGFFTITQSAIAIDEGYYMLRVTSNNEGARGGLGAFSYAGTSYTGGYAAYGNAGQTALGEGIDYNIKLTFDVVPEPASLGMLGLAAGGLLLRRRS